MKLSSSFTISTVVKFIGLISVFNLFLTFFSLLAWTRNSRLTFEIKRDFELAKYPDEKISFDVVACAPLIKLDSKIVLQSAPLQIKHGKILNQRKLSPSDVFFSVRTAKKYHKSRLQLLLDTWISVTSKNVRIFTDEGDKWLMQYIQDKYSDMTRPNIIKMDCPSTAGHKWALLCKMYWEYRTFLSSTEKWFCHFDDDAYVNVRMLMKLLNLYDPKHKIYIGRSPSKKATTVLAYDTENFVAEWMGNYTLNETTWSIPKAKYQRVSFHFALGGAGFCFSRQLALDMRDFAFGSRLLHTAASISLPDDCVIGYIITHMLNISLINTDLMHTHLEDLSELSESSLKNQVTLSYDTPNRDDYEPSRNRENSNFFLQNLTELNNTKYSKSNVISLSGPYSVSLDPSRFRSLHQIIMNEEN